MLLNTLVKPAVIATGQTVELTANGSGMVLCVIIIMMIQNKQHTYYTK